MCGPVDNKKNGVLDDDEFKPRLRIKEGAV